MPEPIACFRDIPHLLGMGFVARSLATAHPANFGDLLMKELMA